MTRRHTICRTLCIAAVLTLAGCASLPEPLRVDTDARAPTPGAVAAAPAEFAESVVRWGGTVVALTHQAESTLLELVARPLDRDARPISERPSTGRFLAVVPGFVEPADVTGDWLVTVSGVVEGVVSGQLGEYVYMYPRLRVIGLHRWSPLPAWPPGYWTDRYWHGPWSGPLHAPFRDEYWWMERSRR
jgi:outer membrane lipoprotein